MNKHKLLLLTLALSLGTGAIFALPTSAIDESETVTNQIVVSDDEEPSDSSTEIITDSGEVITTDEDESQTIENCDESTDPDCQNAPERYDTELENAIDEGLADEPEVICASENEEDCGDEATDPEMWPLYLSLGALGATVVIVIILNIIGRKKK